MRRWIWRISIGLAILIVLVIATVQVILWSPLPKRIVTQLIEKQLGLRISCQSLSTGWLGTSELRNVSLGLPLSQQDFLKVKTLRVKHNTLIGLALGRAVSVDSIEIDRPEIDIMQDGQGQWNLQQVALLLARAGGANSAAQSPASSGVPRLPRIALTNGTVHVSDNQNHVLALEPLNVSGQPDGTLVFKYDATIADAIALHGELAPGTDWQHRVTLSVKHLDPLLKGWGVQTTYAAALKAHWSGQFAGGQLTGQLGLDQATAKEVPTLGDVSVSGAVDVQSAGAVVTLHPVNVNLTTTYVTLPNVGVSSGAIVSDATGLHAQGLKVSALGGLANLDGTFDLASKAVDLQANWSGLSLAKQTSQSGSIKASLRQPFANQPVIHVDLTSNGTVGDSSPDALSPPSRWNAMLNLTGQGSSWSAIDWVLTAPQLTYSSGSQTFDLSQTTAHVTQDLPEIRLADLSLPVNSSTVNNAITFISNGKYNTKTSAWNLDATGGFRASYQDTPVPVSMELHINGRKSRCDLKSFTVGVADITVLADGSYDDTVDREKREKPVKLHVKLTQQPRIVPDAVIQGEVSGDFSIVGILFSDDGHFRPYLTTTGDLTSSDLVLLNHPIGDIDINLTGTTGAPKLSATEYGPICTDLSTTEFYLLQAPWTFIAKYPSPDGVVEATLETHNLSLDELAHVANVTGISGNINKAKWTAKLSSLNILDWNIQSEYHLSHVVAGGVTADTVDASASLQAGILSVPKTSPIIARNGAGKVTATASIDLRTARHLVTETTIEQWPYELSDAVTAVVEGSNIMDIDLKSPQAGASGTLNVSTDLLLGRTHARLAHAHLEGDIRKRLIEITKLDGDILRTGDFSGSFNLDLDKPLGATGRVVVHQVDLATVATVFPAAEGIGGRISLTATLAPARDPRPLGPVRLDLNVASDGAHFRTLQIGGHGLLAAHAVAYLDLDRVVLDHSDIFLGGGVMHLWARADDRKGAGISTQASIEFSHQQLDQWLRIYPGMTKPQPGVFDGQIGLIRSGPHADQLLGSAKFNLTQTDLVNFGPLSSLYNLMNAGGGISDRPSGTGSVDITLEQSVVHLNDLRFFNRGIDAYGLINVGPIDFDDIGNTPLGGQVVGTARVLKGTRVQFLADFDSYFAAIAGQLTTVNLTGTIDHPGYVAAGLGDIGDSMRELLVGGSQ